MKHLHSALKSTRTRLAALAAVAAQPPERHVMRRGVVHGVALTAICALLAFGAPASAQARQQSAAPAPYCGISWGSLDKSVGSRIGDQIPIASVRTGRHACFDRVVIDLRGRQPLAVANYKYGSPNTLQVFVWGWWGFDVPVGASPPVSLVRGLTSISSISAKSPSTYGQEVFITTRGHLPFREFTLPGPDGGSRLVIDIAHRW